MPTFPGSRLFDSLVCSLRLMLFPQAGTRAPRAVRNQAWHAQLTLPVLMLTLIVLPMLMLLYAHREEAQAATQFADVSFSGSLRGRSLWLYGAGQRDAHIPLADRARQRDTMRAIRDVLRKRYPADVAATDAAWARFDADFQAHGYASWPTALAMRNAADRLAKHIEAQAQTQAQQASRLLFVGTFGLALSGLGSLVLLRSLRRAEGTQRRLSAIIDSAPDMISMSDSKGNVLYYNHAFRRFLGLPAAGPLPRILSMNTHAPWSREKMQREARPTALAQGSWEGETALLHPTRGEVPMSQLVVAHRAPQGNLEAWFTIVRDISGRKAAENALLEAETLFRSAIGAMQEGFLVQDAEGKVLMANKCAEEIMGISRGEMVGQAVMRKQWSAVREDGTPFERDDYPSRCALRTGLPQSAVVLGLDKPGDARLWLSVSAAPLFHAGETIPYAAVSTFSDITAQKADADALRQAQERLHTVVGNAPMVLFSLDAEGIFTTSEGRGLELLGLTPGQVVGQSLFEFIGDNAVIETHVRRALAGEAVSYVSEVAGYIWENQYLPLLGAKGLEGIIGTAFDVTDRHMAEEALRQGEERLRHLYEVTSDADLSFEQKMDGLMRMGCAQFGLEKGLLAKINSTLFEIVQSYTPDGADYTGTTCDPQNTFCYEAMQSGEPLGIENIGGSNWAAHPAYDLWKPEAYLGTQVCVGGHSFGTLCFTGGQPHAVPFTTGDKDLLRLMAQWVGSELLRREADQQMRDCNVVLEFQKQETERANQELEQANAQLATLAATDSLTGLCNRRALGERLGVEFVRARRYGSPLSLLMLDVDQFKQYNDAFGHIAGDRILRTVGHMLHDQARITDLPARYGGEEFAVVLPETDASGALVAAERIRRALESQAWPLRAVTVSIGVCTMDASAADAEALIAAADSALYRSKAAGRNCVTHAASLPTPTAAERLPQAA